MTDPASGAATVSVLYFAWLRERVGRVEDVIVLPEGVATVAALTDHLIRLSPRHAHAFADPATVRVAVNQDFADGAAAIGPGDEIAFFPPVTGG